MLSYHRGIGGFADDNDFFLPLSNANPLVYRVVGLREYVGYNILNASYRRSSILDLPDWFVRAVFKHSSSFCSFTLSQTNSLVVSGFGVVVTVVSEIELFFSSIEAFR